MAGKVDTTFVLAGGFSGYNSTVLSSLLLPNGQIIIGGDFISYNDGTNTYDCNAIARLNSDGSFDTSFVYGPGKGFMAVPRPAVYSLALKSDGKIIVGGYFTSYIDGTSTYDCKHIARLNSDGSFDTSFVYGPGTGFSGSFSFVNTLALQLDGKIVVGGIFTSYSDGITAYVCSNVARLNSNGSFDTSFVYGPGTGFSGINSFVNILILQPNGKIILGGYFTSYTDGTSTYVCKDIARLNTNGSFDTSFVYGPGKGFNGSGDYVLALLIQPNGKIIVGGDFTTYTDGANTYDCGKIARLNSDGSLDVNFVHGSGTGLSGLYNLGYTLALQPNGQIILGGTFSAYTDGTSSYVCRNIARLNTNGSFDTSFVYGPGKGFTGQYVITLALQPNGRVVIGGQFPGYNDGTQYSNGNIIRLIAYPVNFQGGNAGNRIGSSVKLSSLKVRGDFKLPISNNPGQNAGTISMDSLGIFLKIRKPDGSVGVVPIL